MVSRRRNGFSDSENDGRDMRAGPGVESGLSNRRRDTGARDDRKQLELCWECSRSHKGEQ